LFKINCHLEVKSPPRTVEKGIALHLYYIVLEAVANAAKHGPARKVVIRLAPEGKFYRLRVRDDGNGFSQSRPGQSGMGIRIMEYRARVIGATLNLQSQPGSGTSVTCQFVPVPGDILPAGDLPGKHHGQIRGEKMAS